MKQIFMTSLFIILAHMGYAENIQKLSVSGEATIFKAADKLSISIGVETYDSDVKKAIQSNAEKMDSIRKALEKIGFTDKELQTKAYTVSPRYTPTPQNPPANWEPTMIGYEVRNTLEVITTKIDQAGHIIDVASGAGANNINSINFSLQDEQQAKEEAIAQAYRRAVAYAEAVRKEADLKLVGIADLTVNQPITNVAMFREAPRSYAFKEITTSISPREVEVSATVSIIYYIGSSPTNK